MAKGDNQQGHMGMGGQGMMPTQMQQIGNGMNAAGSHFGGSPMGGGGMFGPPSMGSHQPGFMPPGLMNNQHAQATGNPWSAPPMMYARYD